MNEEIIEVVDSIKEKEIVLFTNLDNGGDKLYSQLKKIFTQRGVVIDDSLRLILFKHKVSCIEGYTNIKLISFANSHNGAPVR